MSRSRWLLLPFLFFAGCTNNPSKPAVPVEKPKVEATLAVTDLIQEEYDKLQIKTKAAALEDVHERLTLTGWIMAKPGHEVTLTAPTAGYVKVRKGKSFPIAGNKVGTDEELVLLEPVFSPAEKIQVDALKRGFEADKKKADTTLDAAKKELDRTKKLHDEKLKSDQELELAIKAHKHAVEELNAATDKLKLFDTPTRSITAPRAGTLLQVHVGDGQYVPAAAPLVTVIDLNPVWIRVPVPEFDLPIVDRTANIEVVWKNPNHERADKHFNAEPAPLKESPYPTAKPTGRVAQVDPVKRTADLWYELDTTKLPDRFIKDQMVTVRVKVGHKEKATVVPYGAIIFDANGSTWIYVEKPDAKDGKHFFERRRVELAASQEDGIVVRPAIRAGDLVVINGAAALFSREFHKTPVRSAEGK